VEENYITVTLCIGADFSFFLPRAKDELPPHSSFPTSPLPLEVGLINIAAKPQPTNDLVHIISQKVQLCWQQFLLIFLTLQTANHDINDIYK